MPGLAGHPAAEYLIQVRVGGDALPDRRAVGPVPEVRARMLDELARTVGRWQARGAGQQLLGGAGRDLRHFAGLNGWFVPLLNLLPVPSPPPGPAPRTCTWVRPEPSGTFATTYRRRLATLTARPRSRRSRCQMAGTPTPASSLTAMNSWCTPIAGQVTCRSRVSASSGNQPRTSSAHSSRLFARPPGAIPAAAAGSDVLTQRLSVHVQARRYFPQRAARVPVLQHPDHVGYAERSPCHRPGLPSSRSRKNAPFRRPGPLRHARHPHGELCDRVWGILRSSLVRTWAHTPVRPFHIRKPHTHQQSAATSRTPKQERRA